MCRPSGPKRNRARGASRSQDRKPKDGGSDSGASSAAAEPRESRRTRKARARGELQPGERVADGPPLVPSAKVGGGPSISPPPGVPRFARENDDGNVEYKLRLKGPTPFRFQQLVSFDIYGGDWVEMMFHSNYIKDKWHAADICPTAGVADAVPPVRGQRHLLLLSW